jgi:hypothetical protein
MTTPNGESLPWLHYSPSNVTTLLVSASELRAGLFLCQMAIGISYASGPAPTDELVGEAGDSELFGLGTPDEDDGTPAPH